MSSVSDDERQQNFLLAFLLGLIGFVICLVIGVAIFYQGHKPGAPAEPQAAAAQAPASAHAEARRVEVKQVD